MNRNRSIFAFRYPSNLYGTDHSGPIGKIAGGQEFGVAFVGMTRWSLAMLALSVPRGRGPWWGGPDGARPPVWATLHHPPLLGRGMGWALESTCNFPRVTEVERLPQLNVDS